MRSTFVHLLLASATYGIRKSPLRKPCASPPIIFLNSFVGLLSIMLIISGCSTSGEVRLDEQYRSLSDLQKTVDVSLPLGKRSLSQNTRTFRSQYFAINNEGEYIEAKNAPIRYFAEVTIYGDRRPYSIGILVHKEVRTNKGDQYAKDGKDVGLARVIMRRIQKSLHERREDRSIIDDFRIF